MADPSTTVRRLLDGADDVTLPTLTREELVALGDAPVLADGADAQWWTGLDADARQLVVQAAQRGLVARRLLTARPGQDELFVADEVQVILRARHEPSWLVVLREPDQTEGADVRVVVSGIDLRVHETAAALIGIRVDGIYAHRLAAGPTAVEAVVGWLLRPPAPGASTVGRTVEALTPAEVGTTVTYQRAILIGTGAAWQRAFVDTAGNPADPEPIDEAALRTWIGHLMGST